MCNTYAHTHVTRTNTLSAAFSKGWGTGYFDVQIQADISCAERKRLRGQERGLGAQCVGDGLGLKRNSALVCSKMGLENGWKRGQSYCFARAKYLAARALQASVLKSPLYGGFTGREDVFMDTSKHCNYGASFLISGASLGAYFCRSLLLC